MSVWRIRVEYGVIVDRTADGLGFYLAQTYRAVKDADRDLALLAGVYPAAIKVREVIYGDWADLPAATDVTGEHVGGCNDRCNDDGHYLLPTTTPAPVDPAADEQEAL